MHDPQSSDPHHPLEPAPADPSPATIGGPPRRLHTTVRVIESIQTILTALMLAFVFRTFFIEAFIIPTGSMAPALLGEHLSVVCPQCAWQYDVGPMRTSAGATRDQFRNPPFARCPNCHYQLALDETPPPVISGDRILVHKWPYLLRGWLGPHRWNVIVFRDPANPNQNYIKRLVALPGETIEILDGDVFIQQPGQPEPRIARKTAAAQHSLWHVVFDQDYLPAWSRTEQRPPAWVNLRPEDSGSSGWHGLSQRDIRFNPVDDVDHTISFEPMRSQYYLRDLVGYNFDAPDHLVGDVRLHAEVELRGSSGGFAWQITRDNTVFRLRVDTAGRATLERESTDDPNTAPEILDACEIPSIAAGTTTIVELAHVDYRVYVRVDGRRVMQTTDEQYAPDVERLRRSVRVAPVRLRITAGRARLSLSRLRIDRDVHYSYSRHNTLRAYAGKPFRLDAGEYFVLGDNSPNSHDSREWYTVGPHLHAALNAGDYHVGTVRADQIVGQAFFVYLPGLQPLGMDGGLRIPDLGRVRFIR